MWKKIRKESKHDAEENHQNTRKGRKRKGKKQGGIYKSSQKTMNKIANECMPSNYFKY